MKAYIHYGRFGRYFICAECDERLTMSRGVLIHPPFRFVAFVPDLLCPHSKCSHAGKHFLEPEHLSVELKNTTH